MDIPAHNTINPTQCPESPLWPAVEHEHGLCSKDAMHEGAEDCYLQCLPTLEGGLGD